MAQVKVFSLGNIGNPCCPCGGSPGGCGFCTGVTLQEGVALSFAWTACDGSSGSISLAYSATPTPQWNGTLPTCCPAMAATDVVVLCDGQISLNTDGSEPLQSCGLNCDNASSITGGASPVIVWINIAGSGPGCSGGGAICQNFGATEVIPQYCNAFLCGTLTYFDTFTLSQ